MREIEAVLRKHDAMLCIATAAMIWIGDTPVGEIWTSETDGTALEFVDSGVRSDG